MDRTKTMTYRNTARVLTLAASAALLTLSGCETFRSMGRWVGIGKDEPKVSAPVQPSEVAFDPGETPQFGTTQQSVTQSLAVPAIIQPGETVVTKGKISASQPLVYLVEAAGPIRVRNVDTGEEIATFDALSAQIVSVQVRGVYLGSQPVMGASLAPGTYSIIVVPPGNAGTVRSTQTRTTPIPVAPIPGAAAPGATTTPAGASPPRIAPQ